MRTIFYRNDVPHQWDIEIRHSAIESGADLVIVHHPHIIQGLELYQNKLIAHFLWEILFLIWIIRKRCPQ